MKIIGTHNSMTYLPVKKWWMKPLNLIAKCQNRISYNKTGSFDIRIRFDKEGIPYFCHGLVEYKGNVHEKLREWDYIEYCEYKTKYIRLILETSKEDITQERLFVDYVDYLKLKFYNLTYFEFRRKFDWKQLVPDNSNVEVIQYVNSIRCNWIFIPWLYAKIFKKKHQKEFDNYQNSSDRVSIHLFDFL